VIALPAFAVLIGLGTWQLERLAWKAEIIAFREARLAAPAIPLPADLADAGEALAALEYRRVGVAGVLLHEREIYLAASRRGSVGFDVITPLRRAAGGVVLVDRGWTPAAARDPARRPQGQVEGQVAVAGVVRLTGGRGWFTPDNDPARNYWFWLDLPAMTQYAGVDAPPLVVVAGPAPNPGGLPIGKEARVELRNDHLQYAITWYALALALAVIYCLSQRRPPPAAG
jgi:surfeit locus 1 family protein